MKYNLNINTSTYHIEGLCYNSTPIECKSFPTENEVLKYGGRNVKFCKVCQKRFEENFPLFPMRMCRHYRA